MISTSCLSPSLLRPSAEFFREFLGQPFHHLLETTDLSLQKVHPSPQVCVVLFFLTVGRFRVFHGHLLVDRSDLRLVTLRVVAVADGRGGGLGVGVRLASRAPLLPFIGSRQQRGVRMPRGRIPPSRAASRATAATVSVGGGAFR